MMWMMGYNDGGESNSNIQDPFTGRKLRPLMPRPDSTRLPTLTRFHATDHFLALNHHLAVVEHNKREFRTQQVVVSSRWNPTPEQLQTLEELYRTGTRTPTADQIQQITAQLRRYGKIEGKNVFYWFQNHKARERQKRRRQLESLADDHQPPPNNSDNNNNNYNISQSKKGSEKNETQRGLSRTAYEVEETKRWASPSNSSTVAEKSRQGASNGAGEEAELLLSQRGRNATWRTMQLSAGPDSSAHSLPNYPDPRSTAQTLQLFPLESIQEEGGQLVGHVTAPFQFFEFLPLKN